jgi:putative membrane protein
VQSADLAALNALLNSTSAVLLFLAWRAIRGGNEVRHRKLMLSATAVSAAFLVSYLSRLALFGNTLYTGEGVLRSVYFALLISHVILAAVLVPLVLTTLTLALRGRRDKHRRVARFTWPVWMYVSVTGVIIYLMLYQL